jgi:hypothetical protein
MVRHLEFFYLLFKRPHHTKFIFKHELSYERTKLKILKTTCATVM